MATWRGRGMSLWFNRFTRLFKHGGGWRGKKIATKRSRMSYKVEQKISGFGRQSHEVDVCVIGGGMAGMIAAIAAGRHGAKVALVHDRPVLGGNASSEVRMWICGAHGRDMKETGILEEIQLENGYRNSSQVYSIWDNVLYEKVRFCPNVTLLLNCTCNAAKMAGAKIESVTAWQMTSQTFHTIHAKLFIDCSGDSVLAPLTGARVRVGRESRDEFDEDIQPARSDDRTMGNSLLIQARETDEPQPYVAPKWAYKIRSASDLPNRWVMGRGDNFWWMEIGGLQDTIGEAEEIRDELMKLGLGVWDYIKNHWEKRKDFENWGLEWYGALPGKRENRRYVGDHVLTQNDVRNGGQFTDVVAYGGWSMDDHHPAGIFYPGKPTIFHPAPSPYGIPYRSLYSADVPNLFCAGRNISCTHAALSSVRVMGTTSLMGQAVGTAAAMCVQHDCLPAELFPGRMHELQQKLMDDDQYLPGLTRQVSPLTCAARLGGKGDLGALRDGHDRTIGEVAHAWTGALESAIELSWDAPVQVGGLRLVFDSNLNHNKRMPCSYPLKKNHQGVPECMVREYRVEALRDGRWEVIAREENNYQRLVRLPLNVKTAGLRIVPEETWGGEVEEARIFSVDVLQGVPEPIGAVPEGMAWPERVKQIPPADLAEPESGLEATDGRKKTGA
jgi:hypothetical protein